MRHTMGGMDERATVPVSNRHCDMAIMADTFSRMILTTFAGTTIQSESCSATVRQAVAF